ncbi:MAG: hypothetical protein Q7V40_06550 [Pseudolabrys sp.]|nr:hypothetical protein [Pseudolabrys sp.]
MASSSAAFFCASICAGVSGAWAIMDAVSCGAFRAAANGMSGVAARAGVTAKAAPMAVQASRSDLAEFMLESLRMGAGFVPGAVVPLTAYCSAIHCSAIQRFNNSVIQRPRLRAGNPGDRAITFMHVNCSTHELRLNVLRQNCVDCPVFARRSGFFAIDAGQS